MNKAVKRRGFTVVELVIVIAVIAVLAAVLIPAFGNAVEKARESAAVQEAAGAYTEYLIESAAGGNTAEYVFYKTENNVVVLKNGASMGVYETDEEALKAAFDDPETSEDESAGCTLSALGINGLYFMQGSVQAGCGHSYNSVVTPPTCQSGGYTTHTCTLCGDEYTDSETAVSSEHTYVDRKCVDCEISQAGVIVAWIGVTTNGGKSFELISTEVTGIYEAIIENNAPTNNNIFCYDASQFITEDIPETKGHSYVYLKENSGSTVSGSIVFDRNRGTNDIKLEPLKVYRLIIDFTNKTWRIEKIE